MFMCSGIYRKEVKLKEAFVLGGLYNLLSKGRQFENQWTINCGELTRKYMGELMHYKDSFGKVHSGKLLLASIPQI